MMFDSDVGQAFDEFVQFMRDSGQWLFVENMGPTVAVFHLDGDGALCTFQVFFQGTSERLMGLKAFCGDNNLVLSFDTHGAAVLKVSAGGVGRHMRGATVGDLMFALLKVQVL